MLKHVRTLCLCFEIFPEADFLQNLINVCAFGEIPLPKVKHYDNNVHFKGVRFICDPHLAIIGPSEARADLWQGKGSK